MTVPAELGYTAEHEWVRIEDDVAHIGITTHATEELGEVVYAEVADAGTTLQTGEVCGEVESTKAVSEIYAPLDGEILAQNEAVIDEPSLINSDPYGDGWLLTMRMASQPELL